MFPVSGWLQNASMNSLCNLWLLSIMMTITVKKRHPNFVLFIKATTEGKPVIMMEFMPTSLHRKLVKGELAKRGIVLV